MLDMGFKPQVDRIVRRLNRDRQTMFFSATLDGEVGQTRRRVHDATPARHEASFAADRTTASSSTASCRSPPRRSSSADRRCSPRSAGSRSSSSAPSAAPSGSPRSSRAAASSAASLHGDLSQRQRERALRRFDAGEVTTLVATDVAARGLDLDRITHVINFDPPEEHTGLRAPRRSHRPGRPRRHRRHARPPGAAGRGQPRRADARPHRAVRERGHAGRPGADGLHVAPPRLEVGLAERPARKI